jgi:chemosensory pili system protein ChpA (sensor histidine kinase/response regulator)
MAAIPASDFDLGPLSWVKTEIDHSLNQARESLDKLAAAPADRAPVKYILTHLHQATGALSMVGLGAATRFNEELEKLVAQLEAEDAANVPTLVAAAKRAIAALSAYLDALMSGQPDQPMRLLAPYLELNRASGRNDGQEGDLFYPDLTKVLPPPAAVVTLDDPVLAKALAHQRSQYQQGLLRMLGCCACSRAATRPTRCARCTPRSSRSSRCSPPSPTAASGPRPRRSSTRS